jgi:hypothetical protein
MNQEQNNLNLNNFNTQGNNGIPNNQPLNNQSFNQQASNIQPQPTPSFQQPINQINFQQPTQQTINSFESVNANNENFNSKLPKKKNLGLIIGIVVLIVVIGLIVGLVIIANKKGKNPTEEAPQVEKNSITKDEFVKIENQYLQSSNVFNIESVSSFSRIVVTGNVSKGNFSEYDIVEFIDQYGKLRKSPILSIETFKIDNKTIVEGNSGGMLISSISKEDLNYSTIIFKNENYNGIDVSFYYNESELDKIENYFKSKDKINITINDNIESSEIITYYINDDIKTVHLYLILNSDNTYLTNDNVKINDLNILGQIENLLK